MQFMLHCIAQDFHDKISKSIYWKKYIIKNIFVIVISIHIILKVNFLFHYNLKKKYFTNYIQSVFIEGCNSLFYKFHEIEQFIENIKYNSKFIQNKHSCFFS